MTDGRRPSDLDDLGAKLKAALARHGEKPDRAKPASSTSGLSLGLRIGVELVAALAIGVGIGWALDRWLGSSPWMPKSSSVSTSPTPNSCAQKRFTPTRAVSGLSGWTSHRAKSSRSGNSPLRGGSPATESRATSGSL